MPDFRRLSVPRYLNRGSEWIAYLSRLCQKSHKSTQMKTEYIQLQVGDIIQEGDVIDWDKTDWKTAGCPRQPFWRMVNRKCPKGVVVHRKSLDHPILTELALHLIGKNKKNGIVRKFVQRDQIGISYHEITLTDFAVDLLERKHREIQTEKALRETPKHIVHQVHNHTTPIRKVRNIGEATGRMDFDRAERDYHGYEKPLEIATGGHRVRGLDFLIKSRS